VLLCPPQRGFGVLDGSGKRVLGRQPVRHAEHLLPPVPAEQAAHLVVGIEVAEHEAAAVIVNEERQVATGSPVRSKVAGVQRTRGAGDGKVARSADGRGSAADRQDLAAVSRPRLVGRPGGQRVPCGAAKRRQQKLQRGVERLPVDADGGPVRC
jgi:hypothetical protein